MLLDRNLEAAGDEVAVLKDLVGGIDNPALEAAGLGADEEVVRVNLLGDEVQRVADGAVDGGLLAAFGDGGLVTTQDDALAATLRLLRVHGAERQYYHQIIGGNFRLDALQAAVLRVKLKYLDEWNARRTKIAARYHAALASTKHVLPGVPEWANPVWHLYVIRTPQRDALQRHLTEAGIGSLIHYPIPPHLQQAYASLGYKPGDFPIAEAMANEVLSLPIGPQLSTEQHGKVTAALLDFKP